MGRLDDLESEVASLKRLILRSATGDGQRLMLGLDDGVLTGHVEDQPPQLQFCMIYALYSDWYGTKWDRTDVTNSSPWPRCATAVPIDEAGNYTIPVDGSNHPDESQMLLINLGLTQLNINGGTPMGGYYVGLVGSSEIVAADGAMGGEASIIAFQKAYGDAMPIPFNGHAFLDGYAMPCARQPPPSLNNTLTPVVPNALCTCTIKTFYASDGTVLDANSEQIVAYVDATDDTDVVGKVIRLICSMAWHYCDYEETISFMYLPTFGIQDCGEDNVCLCGVLMPVSNQRMNNALSDATQNEASVLDIHTDGGSDPLYTYAIPSYGLTGQTAQFSSGKGTDSGSWQAATYGLVTKSGTLVYAFEAPNETTDELITGGSVTTTTEVTGTDSLTGATLSLTATSTSTFVPETKTIRHRADTADTG